jgi:hypothetical protein
LESPEASQRLTDEKVDQPAVEINPVAFSEPITTAQDGFGEDYLSA